MQPVGKGMNALVTSLRLVTISTSSQEVGCKMLQALCVSP